MIFMDLDGTLLTSGKQLSPANRAALEQAAQRGIYIVPSTGRLYEGMPREVRELPFIRYVSAVNGAQVYDAVEKAVLRQAEIPLEAADRVLRYLESLPVLYDCYIDDWGYMAASSYDRIDAFVPDPAINRLVKGTRQPVEDLRRFVRQKGLPVQKIQLYFIDPDRRVLELERLARDFPELSVTSSLSNNIEINERHANKGEALLFLCRHLGLSAEEAMALGDGSNDLTMIQAAGIGVAMKNASPALLEAADYVTDTNDRDGVAKAIERFCL